MAVSSISQNVSPLPLHPIEIAKEKAWTPSKNIPIWLLIAYRIMAFVPFIFITVIAFMYFSVSRFAQFTPYIPPEISSPSYKRRRKEMIVGFAILSLVGALLVYRFFPFAKRVPMLSSLPQINGNQMDPLFDLSVIARNETHFSHIKPTLLTKNSTLTGLMMTFFSLGTASIIKGPLGSWWEKRGMIGKGRDAIIYPIEVDGKKRALKVFHNTPEARQAAEREIKFLQMIENVPFTPRMLSYAKNSSNIKIVFPRFEKTLANVIDQKRKNGQLPSLEETLYLARQMLFVLHKIEEKGIVHCDIKVDNFMITKSERWRCIDFGDCIQRGTNKLFVEMAYYFSPPEQLQEEKPQNYDHIDMWGLGSLLLYFFSGKILFSDRKVDLSTEENKELNKEQLKRYNQLLKGKGKEPQEIQQPCSSEQGCVFSPDTNLREYFKEHQSEELGDLLLRMLKMNPEDRISPEDALNHSCFQVASTIHSKKYDKVTVFDYGIVRRRCRGKDFLMQFQMQECALNEIEKLGEFNLSKQKSWEGLLKISSTGRYGFILEEKRTKLICPNVSFSLDELKDVDLDELKNADLNHPYPIELQSLY